MDVLLIGLSYEVGFAIWVLTCGVAGNVDFLLLPCLNDLLFVSAGVLFWGVLTCWVIGLLGGLVC